MKVAAIQFGAELGKISANIARAEQLVDEAFGKGARWVILPEFFPTAVAFHPVLEHCALPMDGIAFQMMSAAARRHRGYVGGSFICDRGGERFNTFVLVRPDGTFASHDKDIPTMWEHCYYQGGTDDGIVDTEVGPVGLAMCWELIRNQTAARLRGRVELMVSGTCWAGAAENKVFRSLFPRWEGDNIAMIHRAPGRVARMIGAPVVHASQIGRFEGRTPFLPGLAYRARFLGESQIVNARGEILASAKTDDGERVLVADVSPGRVEPTLAIGEDFWTEPLPEGMNAFWALLNGHGKRHYRRMQRKRARLRRHEEAATS